jgi:hypothetical protein
LYQIGGAEVFKVKRAFKKKFLSRAMVYLLAPDWRAERCKVLPKV